MIRKPFFFAAALIAVFGFAGHQKADDTKNEFSATNVPGTLAATSLSKVPSDVAFYAASMRLGEQLEIFHNSKAFAKLMGLPAVKAALQHAMEETHKPGNDLGKFMEFMHSPENKDLRELIHDLAKHEMFIYGGEDFTRFMKLASEMNSTTNLGTMFKQMQAGMRGQNSEMAQLRAVLDAIKNTSNLTMPDIVIGFKLKSTDPAKTQLARLEKLLQQVLARKPELKDRLKPYAADGAQGFTMEVDGSLVPWDHVPMDKVEDEKGEYQPVVEKLKGLKMTLALVTKGDHMFISFGTGMEQLGKFGKGEALASRKEFAPMRAAGNQRFTSCGYVSEKFMTALATTPADVDHMVKSLKEGLDAAPLSDGLREKIAKDIEGMGGEIKTNLPKPGARMSYEFLTAKGTEGFAYDYSSAVAPTQPLTIIDQLGGSPLAAFAARGPDPTPSYKTMVKWVKIFFDHGMAAAKELVPQQVEQMEEGMKQVMPFIKRFDELTGTMFLPSMADGQSAMVIDGKWQSSAWHPELDQKGEKLAMPEFGLVCSLTDSEKFIKSLQGYRQLVNDIMELARDHGVPIDEKGMPAPETKKFSNGTMYYWPIPDMGQDKQIQPNFGVSKGFMAATMSAGHTERLLASSTISADFKRLSNGKPAMMAGTVDFAGMTAMARPWIEKVGLPMALVEVPEQGPPGMTRAEIPAQVSKLLDVISGLKKFTMVTYRDTNATVTHYETIIEDVK